MNGFQDYEPAGDVIQPLLDMTRATAADTHCATDEWSQVPTGRQAVRARMRL
jgi:hypothetical protein